MTMEKAEETTGIMAKIEKTYKFKGIDSLFEDFYNDIEQFKRG